MLIFILIILIAVRNRGQLPKRSKSPWRNTVGGKVAVWAGRSGSGTHSYGDFLQVVKHIGEGIFRAFLVPGSVRHLQYACS